MRLIDADELKNDHKMGDECDKCETKWRECQYDYIYSKMDFCTWIDDAPTVDAVEVVHGEWIEDAGTYYRSLIERGLGVDEYTPYFTDDIACSACLAKFSVLSNETDFFKYCPNCGAKMIGDEDEQKN